MFAAIWRPTMILLLVCIICKCSRGILLCLVWSVTELLQLDDMVFPRSCHSSAPTDVMLCNVVAVFLMLLKTIYSADKVTRTIARWPSCSLSSTYFSFMLRTIELRVVSPNYECEKHDSIAINHYTHDLYKMYVDFGFHVKYFRTLPTTFN